MKLRALLPALTLLLILLTAITCTPPSTLPDSILQPAPQPANGPIKIIIYTDFQCGACEKLHSEIEPELRERYVATGKAQIEIRLLGTISIDSMRAAQAALCAGDQGRFLEYQNALFRAWREEDVAAYSVEALTRLAASLGLDEAAFTNCLNSEARRAEVEENMKMVQADGVRTLPAFLVGTYKIEGYRPLDTYTQAIQKALATRPP